MDEVHDLFGYVLVVDWFTGKEPARRGRRTTISSNVSCKRFSNAGYAKRSSPTGTIFGQRHRSDDGTCNCFRVVRVHLPGEQGAVRATLVLVLAARTDHGDAAGHGLEEGEAQRIPVESRARPRHRVDIAEPIVVGLALIVTKPAKTTRSATPSGARLVA